MFGLLAEVFLADNGIDDSFRSASVVDVLLRVSTVFKEVFDALEWRG